MPSYFPPSSRSGAELGYAQITSNLTTTSTTAVDAAGLSISVTVGTRPVMVRFNGGSISNDNILGTTTVLVVRDSTVLKIGIVGMKTAGGGAPCHLEIRDAPAAGTYTYKIQYNANTAGTSTLGGAIGLTPFIQVIEV